jgi:predicted LPLAT superfamily acyltransferase
MARRTSTLDNDFSGDRMKERGEHGGRGGSAQPYKNHSLFMAVQNGHVEVVRLLLSGGADVNQARTDTGTTLLFMAAQEGHVEVVRLLLSGGADVNQARTDTGATPLFMAAQNGHVEVVRLLLSGGADVNQARTDTGATPFIIIFFFLASCVAFHFLCSSSTRQPWKSSP